MVQIQNTAKTTFAVNPLARIMVGPNFACDNTCKLVFKQKSSRARLAQVITHTPIGEALKLKELLVGRLCKVCLSSQDHGTDPQVMCQITDIRENMFYSRTHAPISYTEVDTIEVL
jgi:hypothetical protein